MEAAFDADFSDVRVCEGNEPESVGALAVTAGSDIVFGPGRYDPYGPTGRELLGHELTHVLQQRRGPVSGPGGVTADPVLEADADRSGRLAAHGAAVDPPLAPAAVPAVQPKIGQEGASLVGRSVRKAGRQPAYVITQAREDGGSWSYQLRHSLLKQDMGWVGGDDEGYDLAAVATQSPQEAAVASFIGRYRRDKLAVKVASWVPEGETANDRAVMVQVNHDRDSEEKEPSDPGTKAEEPSDPGSEKTRYILWSGGAADCIIVAAYDGGKGYLAHQSRIGPDVRSMLRRIEALGAPTVWLASMMFGAEGAGRQELVTDIVLAVEKSGLSVGGVFTGDRLALNTETGAVSTTFTTKGDDPELGISKEEQQRLLNLMDSKRKPGPAQDQ
jgi:hypothetical protein